MSPGIQFDDECSKLFFLCSDDRLIRESISQSNSVNEKGLSLSDWRWMVPESELVTDLERFQSSRANNGKSS